MSANVLNAFMSGQQFRNDQDDRRQRNALMMDDRRAQQANTNVNALMMGGQQQEAPRYEGQAETNLTGMDKARGAAIQSGNPDVMANFQQQVAQMDTATREQNEALFREVGRLGTSMVSLTPEQRVIALDSEAPRLLTMGVPQEEIVRYRELFANPQTSDAVVTALTSRAVEAQSVFDTYAPQMQAENEVLSRFQNGQQVQGPVNPNAPANRGIEQQNADARGLSAQASMLGSQARYQQAQTEAAGAPGERRNGQFTQERQLRQEFTSITSDYRDIQQSLGTIETMANRGDAQGDLALVVAFTKLLDPGSVAREGEVSLTQSSASTVQQASNWLNQLQRGNTILPQEVRAAFLSASQELAGQYRNSFDARRSEYSSIAQEYGLNADRVTIGGPAQQAMNEPSIDDLLNQYGD